MKNIGFFSIILSLMFFACTPKSGKDMSKTANAENKAAAVVKGKAPVIPIPTGDVRKMAPKAGSAPTIQVGKAETFSLDNGLKVIVVENHKLPKVSYRLFVDYDPVLEKEAIGFVEMTGELLSKGTKTRTKAQIDADVDFIGANLSSDANGLSGFCLSKHSDKLLSLMSDVLLNPAFPEEELNKARTRQQSSLASAKEDAGTISRNVSSVLNYGKEHPYGEVMTEASLSKVTLDQIKNHYNSYFKPNISYLVVTGDVTKAQAMKQAEKYFGKWQKGTVKENVYPIPRAPEKAVVDFVHKAGAVQSVVLITYPLDLAPGTPDVIRSRVANAILGGYFNSRVNANLREGHGWTYGARTSISPDELVGNFSGSCSVRNAVTDSSIIEFLKEMEKMRNTKVDAQELQVVKNVLAGQFSQSLEEPGTVANFALNTARYKLPADYYEKYLEVLQNVSAEEVLAAAQKYITPGRAHILVVGNKEDVAERLKQFSSDGKVNFYDAFGTPVKNISANMPPGMTAEKVVEDYINAIGGTAKIAEIKDLQSNATMETRGPKFGVKTWQKGGDKIAVEMSMNGQTMSKQLFDGTKGVQSGMGAPAEELKGEQLEDIKEQARFCKELNYLKGGYKLALMGLEEIDGTACYAVEVVRPDGKKTMEYYSIKNSLKVREVSSTPGGEEGQMVTQITDMSDYKAVNGVMMPHQMVVSGVFPVPFKVIMNEIKVNAGVDDGVFKN